MIINIFWFRKVQRLKINLFTPTPGGVNWFSSLPLGPG